MNTEKLTVAIIGCGGRGKDVYAKAQEKLSDQMQIVAAVDINPKQLYEMETEYGVPKENCFCSVDDFFFILINYEISKTKFLPSNRRLL